MLSLRIQEHRETATRAGLLYVTDGVAGIRRQRAGRLGVLCAGRRPDLGRSRAPPHPAVVIPPPGPTCGSVRILTPHPATARDARGGSSTGTPLYRAARDKSKFRACSSSARSSRHPRAGGARPARRRPDPAADPRHCCASSGQDADPRRQRRVRAREPLLRLHPARPPRGDQRLAAALHLSRKSASATRSRSPIAGSPASCSSARPAGQELFQYLDTKGRRQTISSDDVNAYLRETTGRDITGRISGPGRAPCSPPSSCARSGRRRPGEAERNMLRRSTRCRPARQHARCLPEVLHTPGLLRATSRAHRDAAFATPHALRRENPPAALRRTRWRAAFLQERPWRISPGLVPATVGGSGVRWSASRLRE